MNNDIKTRELRLILKICGYYQADLARYIAKSPAFVHRLCIDYDVPVPFRWVEHARRMVGDENFEVALVQARIKIESRRRK